MTFRSLIDIVVHLESFRNIDLFYQGQYILRFQLYINDGNTKIFAHPYALSDSYKVNDDV
jgi:hypothetical protein